MEECVKRNFRSCELIVVLVQSIDRIYPFEGYAGGTIDNNDHALEKPSKGWLSDQTTDGWTMDYQPTFSNLRM